MATLSYWARWHWFDWPLCSRYSGSRRVLDYVPMRMRAWPGLRRYYWQAREMVKVDSYVERYRDLFR